MVATGTALLARLKLYAVTAQATEVAEQLVKAHVAHASQMGMQQVSKLINTLSTHLMDLSEELLKSDSPALPATTAAALARKQGALSAATALTMLIAVRLHDSLAQYLAFLLILLLLNCITVLRNVPPFGWFCFDIAPC